MHCQTIALFGEAERGSYRTPYRCQNLAQLIDYFGHPPEDSSGLFYAIQALLFDYSILFLRVEEEGFSQQDYFQGLQLLKKEEMTNHIGAYCMPGVADTEIIDTLVPLCRKHHSLIITNEADLYDYLTA